MLYLILNLTLVMIFNTCVGAMAKSAAKAGHAAPAVAVAPAGFAHRQTECRMLVALTSEQKVKIEQFNQQILTAHRDHYGSVQAMASATWKTQKEIIKKAVEQGIHPDALSIYSYRKGLRTPLHYVVNEQEEDIDFGRFLLNNGANVCQIVSEICAPDKKIFLFTQVRNLSWANLFLQHGVSAILHSHGSELVFYAAENCNPYPILPWYFAHGIDVNIAHAGESLLHRIALSCTANRYVPEMATYFLQTTRLLTEKGIDVSAKIAAQFPHRMNGYTVPQIIKFRLENINEEEQYRDIEREETKVLLNCMRNLLIATSSNSSEKLKEVEQEIKMITLLAPELLLIIRSYCIFTYLELEVIPYPSKKN